MATRREERKVLNMLDPRKVDLDRHAFRGNMILVAVSDAYAYDGNQRTDVINAVRCAVLMPAYGYKRMSVKLPVGTTVEPTLIGKNVEFTDFVARVYSIDGRVGYTATASGVAIAKT